MKIFWYNFVCKSTMKLSYEVHKKTHYTLHYNIFLHFVLKAGNSIANIKSTNTVLPLGKHEYCAAYRLHESNIFTVKHYTMAYIFFSDIYIYTQGLY